MSICYSPSIVSLKMFEIICRDLSKTYTTQAGVSQPLDGLNVAFNAGEVTAVIGESGCGKTTLLRLLAGLEVADAGEILFKNKMDAPTKAPVLSVVFQEPRLFHWLSVRDNVELPIRDLPQEERNERSQAILKTVGLTKYASAYPSELSGGMAQRVGLARALIDRPDILILDEAFSALDALTRRRLYQEFYDLVIKERITTILVTHDISEAVLLAKNIIRVANGQIQTQHRVTQDYPRSLSMPGISDQIEEIFKEFSKTKELQ